ncbi:MAG: hypothetical protein JXR77_00750 [Lentisphaeria bacterium]|nr:hypothetical protein [Lentisphaeria bacterium]
MPAVECIHDLRDLARNPAQRDYVRAAAATVADAIEQAAADVETGVKHRCQRCNAAVSAEEFARSDEAFQRVFCDRCFDEVFLQRRNFETQVEITKTIEARDGTVVQSEGERPLPRPSAGTNWSQPSPTPFWFHTPYLTVRPGLPSVRHRADSNPCFPLTLRI